MNDLAFVGILIAIVGLGYAWLRLVDCECRWIPLVLINGKTVYVQVGEIATIWFDKVTAIRTSAGDYLQTTDNDTILLLVSIVSGG